MDDIPVDFDSFLNFDCSSPNAAVDLTYGGSIVAAPLSSYRNADQQRPANPSCNEQIPPKARDEIDEKDIKFELQKVELQQRLHRARRQKEAGSDQAQDDDVVDIELELCKVELHQRLHNMRKGKQAASMPSLNPATTTCGAKTLSTGGTRPAWAPEGQTDSSSLGLDPVFDANGDMFQYQFLTSSENVNGMNFDNILTESLQDSSLTLPQPNDPYVEAMFDFPQAPTYSSRQDITNSFHATDLEWHGKNIESSTAALPSQLQSEFFSSSVGQSTDISLSISQPLQINPGRISNYTFTQTAPANDISGKQRIGGTMSQVIPPKPERNPKIDSSLVACKSRKRRSSDPDIPGFLCFSLGPQQPPPKRVRNRMTKQQLEKVKIVKKMGACIRCRRLKIAVLELLLLGLGRRTDTVAQCSGTDPCQSCIEALARRCNEVDLSLNLCVRPSLINKNIFAYGGFSILVMRIIVNFSRGRRRPVLFEIWAYIPLFLGSCTSNHKFDLYRSKQGEKASRTPTFSQIPSQRLRDTAFHW
jgi:hypothetical protein